jgi:hypothetical protein
MAKIQKAVEYFQDNSPDSPELNKVVRDQQSNVRSLRTSVPTLSHDKYLLSLKKHVE